MSNIRADLPAVLPDLTRFVRSLKSSFGYEDLVHDTIVRALENEHNFDGRNLKSWLFTIARNLVCNKTRRKPQLPTDPHADTFMRLEARTSWDAIDELRDLRRAFDGLTPAHQAILTSAAMNATGGRYYEYEAIGEELGIGIGTVRSRLSRARAGLRSAMA